jgi:hypothetical protein
MKPRTIDNLGVDSSKRYAKDQEILDAHFLQDSRLIPQKAEQPTLKPYVPSEFEQLFAPGKQILWAAFAAPPNYYMEAKTVFSYQLIPSLGGSEKQEADAEKIESLQDALNKPYKDNQGQDSSEQDKEEQERQVLLALLECIKKLDKTLSLINAKRNQYQRG